MITKEESLAQLDKFSTYGPDWDYEGAPPISPTALEMARRIILDTDTDACWVVPTHSGGVTLEWQASNPNLYVEAEITPNGDVEVFTMVGHKSFHFVIPKS